MNKEYRQIEKLLCELRSEYALSSNGEIDPDLPITERDIVSEIYCRLQSLFRDAELSVHTEIKPAPSIASEPEALKSLPRIDVAILKNTDSKSWLSDAKKIQGKYKKGNIEARFSSIPIEFFHTAIEVKIQSKPIDSKKDIDTLFQINQKNQACNCFLILLNARGKRKDHSAIKEYSSEKGISFIEHTSN